jgi:hypothetical protein
MPRDLLRVSRSSLTVLEHCIPPRAPSWLMDPRIFLIIYSDYDLSLESLVDVVEVQVTVFGGEYPQRGF